jgi:hypothetical protein
VTGDQAVSVFAWLGLALWVGSFALFVTRSYRAAATLQAVIALPFAIATLITLIKWRMDPAAYVRQYGTGALGELRGDGLVLVVSLVILVACGLAIRHHRLWLIAPLLVNAVGVAFLFYLAYFFHVF